ncbi:MAG: FAD-dependent oxidoreductase, partial [Actinomycetota bacterium]|nr:FAD-dependent oxidoreductase [Actinomycetota bacterium]
RGDGVFVVGDMVAAPGLLSEVSHASALRAVAALVGGGRGRLLPASYC